MKRTIPIAVAFLAGLFAAKLWQEFPVEAQGGGSAPVALENGDTNGDGERDLSDAVHLLRWLFLTGDPPVPVSREPLPRFTDNGDGTITDNQTGLMWLRRAADADGDGAIGMGDSVSHSQASELVAALRTGGHADWRLPLTSEMASLVEYPAAPWNQSVLDPLFDPSGGTFWIFSSNGGDPCHGANFIMSANGFIGLNQWFAWVLAVRTP